MTIGKVLNLPYQPTSFIGRDHEISQIKALLTDPDCRLLTLVGPGGVGKTRLAIQAATELAANYRDGVCFVDLQPIHSTEFLASTVADALNIHLNGQSDPRLQLLHYLQDKEMLFILDNYEQLLSQEPELLGHVLHHAPGVHLLVTSRAALNLQEEWLWTVPGLDFPDEEGGDALETYSAVKLFAERAWRVRKDFSLEDEAEGVVRICRLVEGLPLALELAASWTKTLSCMAIADEIQHNLDFLTTTLRNVPKRQRSMQAIFEQSWKMLTPQEQNAFKRLSVFLGGFRYDAARQVAGASLPILSVLVDKSLLRWEPGGRYRIHELLRQYAQEMLDEVPEESIETRRSHSDYYTNLLHKLGHEISSARQREAIEEIAAELENVRAGWAYAVRYASVAHIQRAAFTFSQFCDLQSRYQEGIESFEKAVHSLEALEPGDDRDRTLARLYTIMGWQYIRLGRFDEAQATFTRGREMYGKLNTSPPAEFGSDPISGLALVAATVGDYAKALELGEIARRQNEARNDRQSLQIVFYVLASAALSLGRCEAAWEYARQAYALTQETGNRWMMAYVLTVMGNVERASGQYRQARQHYQASYDMKQSFHDPEGIAVAMNHLGRIAWLEGAYEEAAEWYHQSQDIYEQISDWGGLATSLHGLGDTSLALGDIPAAGRYYRQALDISIEIDWAPMILLLLTSYAELLHQTGRSEESARYLTLVLAHPASDLATRERAERSFKQLRASSEAKHVTPIPAGEVEKQLDEIAAEVQAELAVHATQPVSEPAADQSPTVPVEQPLLEPLTPRELEVLQLIAAGKTNQQIADTLILSAGTVKWYTGQIYSKLNVSHRTEAVAYAREINLLN